MLAPKSVDAAFLLSFDLGMRQVGGTVPCGVCGSIYSVCNRYAPDIGEFLP